MKTSVYIILLFLFLSACSRNIEQKETENTNVPNVFESDVIDEVENANDIAQPSSSPESISEAEGGKFN